MVLALVDAERRVRETREYHLELMAAAFLKETGLPASQVELVETRVGDTVRWHFQPLRSTIEIEYAK
jgi:hypothetical protein